MHKIQLYIAAPGEIYSADKKYSKNRQKTFPRKLYEAEMGHTNYSTNM